LGQKVKHRLHDSGNIFRAFWGFSLLQAKGDSIVQPDRLDQEWRPVNNLLITMLISGSFYFLEDLFS
jgi:hypothetical protein